MGLGAAMTFPATLSLISNVFTGRAERARAIGLWGAIGGVAIALGPIVGGWLLEHFSWSSVFVAMGPVAAAGIVLAAWRCPRRSPPVRPARRDRACCSRPPPRPCSSHDHRGAVRGWASARSAAGFAGAAVLAAAFGWRERRAADPMLDIRLFRNMRFTAASGSVTISFFTLFGFIFLMTQYFQFIRGYGPLSTGVHLLPVALSVGVGSVLGTQLAVRRGTKLIVTLGLLAMTGFYGWVAATTTTSVSYGIIAAQMVLYGLGMGFTSAPATESIMGAVSLRRPASARRSTTPPGCSAARSGSRSSAASTRRSTARGSPRSCRPRCRGGWRAVAHQSVGAALSVAGRLGAAGQRAAGGLVRDAATNAFLHGLTVGCLVAGGVAAGGAILAAVFLPAQPAGRAATARGSDRPGAADSAPAAGADRDAEVARAAQ